MTRTGSALPIRSALDGLQLEFPEYGISQQVIGDRLFYVAEAVDPLVRPVFAQAQTVDRLRAKLRVPEVEVNAAVPTIARVYDFLLGGKDNFEADRAQARNVLEVYPQAAELVIQARQFQARAVAYAAQQGIGQFLDVGCGLPTAPNTHQTAQAITPDARIVYVDNDAQVLTHARNLLAQSTGVLACAGDLAYPAEILYDWRVRRFLDFHQPLCLILAMTMHFLCATRRTAVSPAQRAGIGGDVSGSDGLPVTRKCHRENSMPANRRSRPGVWGDVPGDPRDMAKAGLPESQSPEGVCMPPAGKTPETGTGPYGRVEENLP